MHKIVKLSLEVCDNVTVGWLKCRMWRVWWLDRHRYNIGNEWLEKWLIEVDDSELNAVNCWLVTAVNVAANRPIVSATVVNDTNLSQIQVMIVFVPTCHPFMGGWWVAYLQKVIGWHAHWQPFITHLIHKNDSTCSFVILCTSHTIP